MGRFAGDAAAVSGGEMRAPHRNLGNAGHEMFDDLGR